MRKLILVISALLGLTATAHGHLINPVPYSEASSLNDVAHQAAFGIFQTYAPSPGPPQITFNMLSPPGGVTPVATCNGDKQTVTLTVTTGMFSPTLRVFSNQFTGGDVGKAIIVPNAGNNPTLNWIGKINAVGSFNGTYQDLTINSNAGTVLTSQSKAVTYGSDDAPAFNAFNNWARANQGSNNQVVLTVPNGSVCWFGTGAFNYVNTINAWAAGINNLIVEGTGATLDSVNGAGFTLGAPGICTSGITDANGCSARIQTVSAGASTITLTADSLAAGYMSRFPLDQWIMIGGLDIQGLFQSAFGDPPNNNYFEWRQVVGRNVGTGAITLDRPLSNSYQSDWSLYSSGSAGQQDQGGPATIWAVGNSGVGGTQNAWNTTQEFRGMTFTTDGQIYGRGRNITYRNVTFGNSQGAIPSQNESWSAINTSYPLQIMEVDKLIGTLLMDGVTIPQIVFQSSSTNLFIMRNSNVTNRLDGGAKRSEISDSVLNIWGPGVVYYGNIVGESICTRCTITTNLDTQLGYVLTYDPFPYSMSGGLITVPNSINQTQGPLVPGTRFFYSVTGFGTIGMAQITTVTGDPAWPAPDNQTASTNVTTTNGSNSMTVSTAPFTVGDIGKVLIVPGGRAPNNNLNTFITGVSGSGPQTITLGSNATRSQSAVTQTVQWGTSNTYAQTTAVGGFPDTSSLAATPLQIYVRATPSFTCDQCNVGTPNSNAYGMSVQAGATPGAPLGSYIARTFTPSTVALQATMPSFGKFVSLTVDVTQPFVGTGTSLLNPTAQFAANQVTIDQSVSPLTTFRFWPTINLKQAGKRVITPGGVTCDTGGGPVAGGCSGDTISAPSGSPLTGGYPPNAVWIQNQITPWTAGTFSGMTTPPTFTITMQTDQVP